MPRYLTEEAYYHLRAQFAAAALQGLLANQGDALDFGATAEDAFAYADAMLEVWQGTAVEEDH